MTAIVKLLLGICLSMLSLLAGHHKIQPITSPVPTTTTTLPVLVIPVTIPLIDQYPYVANLISGTVSVIATSTGTVVATIAMGASSSP